MSTSVQPDRHLAQARRNIGGGICSCIDGQTGSVGDECVLQSLTDTVFNELSSKTSCFRNSEVGGRLRAALDVILHVTLRPNDDIHLPLSLGDKVRVVA